MTNQFNSYEKLFRAVYPPTVLPIFWKENGKISSAAFKDKNGLSVERSHNRSDNAVIKDMLYFFHGHILTVTVKDCENCNAIVKYLPTKRSVYHSEIHGSNEKNYYHNLNASIWLIMQLYVYRNNSLRQNSTLLPTLIS